MIGKTTRRRLPWWCRDPSLDFKEEHERVHRRVCPHRTECEQLISAVAPVDYDIYKYARQQLRAAIRNAGPEFAAQLREMRRASAVMFEYYTLVKYSLASNAIVMALKEIHYSAVDQPSRKIRFGHRWCPNNSEVK